MTDSPEAQETDVVENGATEQKSESPAWRRRFLGDIHVGSLVGTARPVPGAGTAKGEKAILSAMGQVLDRVRNSIRERSTASTSARI